MNRIVLFFICSLLSCTWVTCFAQTSVKDTNADKDLVQFSGVVVTGDSLKPVPFTNIVIKDSFRGTVSDYYGFFSFVAKKADTVEFSGVGFKKARYVVPDTLTQNKYSLIQMLSRDTIYLRETVIYAWPTQEQFREAFLKLNIPDDDLARAQKNLARQKLKEMGRNMPMDATQNYNYAMQQQQNQLYSTGQYPTNHLLDPLAWAKFIQAWQNGDFKEQDK